MPNAANINAHVLHVYHINCYAHTANTNSIGSSHFQYTLAATKHRDWSDFYNMQTGLSHYGRATGAEWNGPL